MRRIGLLLGLALSLIACDGGPAQPEQKQAGQRSPEQVYQGYCVYCHANGTAGAPAVGPEHRLYWSHEVEEEGFETIVQEAIDGINAMPPRGGCGDCTDREIRDTVIYMLKESGAK